MKPVELAVLAGFSVAVVAFGTALAWLKRESTIEPVAPPAEPITFQYETFTPAPKELGFIDQWRFDSCMTDAAKNPTTHGVNTAARVCRRRFEQ